MSQAIPLMRVAVVGARRERQGTGEFIARALAGQGCRVESIVGTSPATCAAAAKGLRERHGLGVRTYLSLAELLERERPDVVAIASPAEHHLAALELALGAGCHVFCEKPLFWSERLEGPEAAGEVRATAGRLVALAERAGRLLALDTQWPETLDAFRALHPRALEGPLARLDMWLSPLSEGPTMVVDSAPHVLSLAHALRGAGSVEAVRASAPAPGSLELGFDYRHETGTLAVALHLVRCLEPPRPAAYAIDGERADRRIRLPGYELSLESGGRTVPLADPLDRRVARFVRDANAGARPDRLAVVEGMVQLHALVSAVAAKSRGLS